MFFPRPLEPSLRRYGRRSSLRTWNRSPRMPWWSKGSDGKFLSKWRSSSKKSWVKSLWLPYFDIFWGIWRSINCHKSQRFSMTWGEFHPFCHRRLDFNMSFPETVVVASAGSERCYTVPVGNGDVSHIPLGIIWLVVTGTMEHIWWIVVNSGELWLP